MKKITKEDVKRFGVKVLFGTVMTAQSLFAGKKSGDNWKKNKTKSCVISGVSALTNVGLIAIEKPIEDKICSITFNKKEKKGTFQEPKEFHQNKDPETIIQN